MALDLNRKVTAAELGNLATRTVAALNALSDTYLAKTEANNFVTDSDLSGYVETETGKGLSTNDFTTAEKNKLSGVENNAQANVIETVKVNGTALTPNNKAVDIVFSDTYLTKTDAGNTYLDKSTANSDFLKKTDASDTYLTKDTASTTYLATATANTDFLKKADASTTYLTKTDADSIRADVNSLQSTVKHIAQFTDYPVRYGFKVKKSESSPSNRVEYLYDAVGFTPAAMNFSTGKFNYGSWKDVWFVKDNKPLMLKSDGTVDYFLDPNDYSKKLDGTASDVANSNYDGNAMAQFPLVWVYRYEDDEYCYEIVSNVQWDDNYKAYAHTRSNGSIADYFYHAMFNGSGNSTLLRSLSGKSPCNGHNISAQQFFDAAQDNGSKWGLASWSQRNLICTLLTLLGKTTNIKAAFGDGRHRGSGGQNGSANPVTTGGSNSSGQFFGVSYTSNNQTRNVKVFHVESFYGEQCKVTPGLLCKNAEFFVKMTPENGGYSLSDTSGFSDTGFTALNPSNIADIQPIVFFQTHCGDFGVIPVVEETGTRYVNGNNSQFYASLIDAFLKAKFVDAATLAENPDTSLVTTCALCGNDAFFEALWSSPFNLCVAITSSVTIVDSSTSNLLAFNGLLSCEG